MSKISDKDKKDWEDFLSDNKKLPNKDFSDKISLQTKKTEIDLHGYTLDEANIEIEKFILKSYEYGYKILRIVTGKGLHSDNEKNPFVSKDLSILKYYVPEYIKNNNNLMKLISEFKEATVEKVERGFYYYS